MKPSNAVPGGPVVGGADARTTAVGTRSSTRRQATTWLPTALADVDGHSVGGGASVTLAVVAGPGTGGVVVLAGLPGSAADVVDTSAGDEGQRRDEEGHCSETPPHAATLAEVRLRRGRSIPHRARTTSASCSATSLATVASVASTITRSSGSVPLARSEHPAVAGEAGLDCGDLGGDLLGGVGDALDDGDVDEHLGQPRHRCGGEVGQAGTRAHHHVGEDDAGEQPVARRRPVTEDHVPALLATHREPAFVERFEDVAVTDRRLDDVDPFTLHGDAEPEVGHHRGDDRGVAQGAAAMQVGGADGHDVVAVDDTTGVIHGEQSVCVAVEGEPEVGGLDDHSGGEGVEVSGPAVVVDVAAVGGVVDGDHVGTGGGEQAGGDGAGRPVGAVDDDAQAGQRAALEGVDEVGEVVGALLGVEQLGRLAARRREGERPRARCAPRSRRGASSRRGRTA